MKYYDYRLISHHNHFSNHSFQFLATSSELHLIFSDSIKAWQEALTDAFPNGSPVPVGDLTIPIASFKPKTLEDLVALGNSLEEGIRDFVRPQQMPMGVVMAFNYIELSPTGDVVSEILIGRKMIERLKRKIQGMEVEDTLPIDFGPHTLTDSFDELLQKNHAFYSHLYGSVCIVEPFSLDGFQACIPIIPLHQRTDDKPKDRGPTGVTASLLDYFCNQVSVLITTLKKRLS